jgi:NitT/TauT family transport system ATP-binding protein
MEFIPRPKPAITGNEAVHLEDAYHGYLDSSTGRVKTVLNDIDLIVSRGEFVSLVGPSGCGKSTLLKLFTGQEIVQQAKYFQVLGRMPSFPDRTRGVVFQNYGLAPHLTVLRNILLGLEFQASLLQRFSRTWWKQAKDMARKYLDDMRLTDASKKYPTELSGGMRQRVAIAQTLITIDLFGMPDLICMDESYGALDASTREDLQIFILKLWEKYKKTIVFVTHNLEEAVFLGTRVVVLSQFWTSDQPEAQQVGSRIVMDIPLEPHAMSTEVKQTSEFKDLTKYILDRGFNPKQRLHVAQFNADLRHPNAFSSLTKEQCSSALTDQPAPASPPPSESKTE